MRHKHGQELSSINEQLESFKKTKVGLEKQKQTLEAENADLATELRNVNQSRQENDRRRKQAEQQFAEVQVLFMHSKNLTYFLINMLWIHIVTDEIRWTRTSTVRDARENAKIATRIGYSYATIGRSWD